MSGEGSGGRAGAEQEGLSAGLRLKQRPRQREEQAQGPGAGLRHILATAVDPCGRSTGMEGGSSKR